MSVAESDRGSLHKETGPELKPSEWHELGEAAAIQPHLGDFMIGTPAGFANSLAALTAGVTTIGNLGQYSAFELPGGQDDIQVTEEATVAIGLLAACRERGGLVHSYLEDGVAMQASHYGSYVGWAALEVYVVEVAVRRAAGALLRWTDRLPWHRAASTWRSTTCTAATRSARWSTATRSTCGPRSRAQPGRADHLVPRHRLPAAPPHRPRGHPVPLTEAERIPSAAENVEVQVIAHELEREARRSGDLFDWRRLERLGADLAEYGERFRDRALALPARRRRRHHRPRSGAAGDAAARHGRLEQRVDLTPPPRSAGWSRGRPGWSRGCDARGSALRRLDGMRIVLAALDVHDVVRDALALALPRRAARSSCCPTDVTPAAIAEVAVAEDADVIILGTYNGAALSIGRELRAAIDRAASRPGDRRRPAERGRGRRPAGRRQRRSSRRSASHPRSEVEDAARLLGATAVRGALTRWRPRPNS